MIRVGIGGWTFEPWRGTFYPKGLQHARELEYAASQLTAIEVNGTFYGTIKRESFQRWHDETPDDFVFSLKAPRFATNRRVLGEAAPSIERFFGSGVMDLREKLGPILWQFAPTKKFDADDFAAFIALLPREIDGRAIRHALEVRNASFAAADFVTLARDKDVAIVFADSDKFPMIADVTADFVYQRLQRTVESEKTGYSSAAIKQWAAHAETWASGGAPKDFSLLVKAPAKKKRDVFAFMISGAKVRAPAAAMALIEALKA
jgi:uncharacterized protein YecE (DUF72 family)